MFPEIITELLRDGYKVSFSAPGYSMFPTIMANETIMVEPIDPEKVKLGEIILYRTNGRVIAHRLVAINMVISNNSPSHSESATRTSVLSPHHLFIFRGDAATSCDAPVRSGQILGKVVSIERNGCCIDPYSFSHKLGCFARRWTSRFKAKLN